MEPTGVAVPRAGWRAAAGVGAARADAIDAARQAIARAQAAAQENRPEEALERYAEALTLPFDNVTGLAIRADALRGAGIVHQSRAGWPEAQRHFQESRDAAVQLGDENRIARAENCLGAVAFESGDWFSAERYYGDARRSAESAGDYALVAMIDNNMGTLYAARGEPERAEEAFRRVLERLKEFDQLPCAARVLNNLGLVLVKQHRYPQAAIAYDQALAECKRRGDAMFATKILINKARLSLAREEPIEAHASAMKAWAFARRLKDGPVAAGALCVLGEVALNLRDIVGAIYYLRRALKLAADGKAPLVEAETWIQMGDLYQAQGNLDRAVDTWRFARLCYRRLGARAEADRLTERIDAAMQPAAGGSAPPEADPEPIGAGLPEGSFRTGVYAA